MADLFRHQGELRRSANAPLADRMRPSTLDDFVGQESILGPGRLLRRAIAADRVGNLILHGPPGVGKTTLARIIAGSTRAHFSSLNAVLAGVKDLRAEVDSARQRLDLHGLRTILFIDEVHRFNSAQQDALLPWVENGTLTLIGATTENPFFEVNKALVSRSRLFRLQPLQATHLQQLLERALKDPEQGYGTRDITITADAAHHLIDVCSGDARSLLNALELAVETSEQGAEGAIHIDLAIAEESIQQRAVLYDKQGDAHFDTISAFIKSLRGSDPDAALFWLARMIEAGESPRFIFRRMLISAGEDIGLADPQAVVVVEACAAAFERVGLPEGLYPLAEAALYLAGAEKSNSLLGFFDALRRVRETNRQDVPSHLRDANRDGKAFGDGVGYRYPHAYTDHWVEQQYLPKSLQGQVFWQPGAFGWEGQLSRRLQQRRAAQLAVTAETEAEQVDWLSSSPEDPELERWLQRQAVADGSRLDRLRQRLWQGVQWRRHDRVLILDGRSLLWCLDPLGESPEGGVVIAVGDNQMATSLEAQLQLLDALRRPEIVVMSAETPQALNTQCGETRFEWIAGRQPWPKLPAVMVSEWIKQLETQLVSDGKCRLLFSSAGLGPANALLQANSVPLDRASSIVLQRAAELEARSLAKLQQDHQHWLAAFQERGWSIQTEEWREPLHLKLNASLLRRWLEPSSAYRQEIADLEPEGFEVLSQLLQKNLGQQLPQEVRHNMLCARRC